MTHLRIDRSTPWPACLALRLATLLLATLLLATAALGQTAPTERVGPLLDGSYLLNTGWVLRPAGRQVPLGAFPIQTSVSPDGRHLLVVNSGGEEPSLLVFDTGTFEQTDRVVLPDAWYGMAFVPGGRVFYVSGGASANVYEFNLTDDGRLERRRTFQAVDRGATPTADDFVGDLRFSPDGRLLYAVAPFRNQVLVINPQSGWVIERLDTARRPYRVLPHPDGTSLLVTSWAEGSLDSLSASDGTQLNRWRLALQPMDMVWQDQPPAVEENEAPPPWRARLFVAASSSNRIYVLGSSGDADLTQLETIRISMWPQQPVGMTPSALALSEDQSRLYVVCSDANVVAVVDVSGVSSRVLGFIPTGWYPTDVAPLDDGRIVVLNGKGGGTGPGTASLIDAADAPALFQYTKTSLRLSPYTDERMIGYPTPDGNPIPPGPRVPDEMRSPIQHVLYIVKGSRSFDQVLGDLGKGDGDPSLATFGKDVTPNQHKLASEFALFDNFYAMGDTNADGRMWSTAAIAPAYIERLLPNARAGRLDRDLNEYTLAAAPPAGFIWNQALQAGLPLRNYGFAVRNRAQPQAGRLHVERVLDPALDQVTVGTFRGFDVDYPDVDRAKAFLADLQAMETTGEMPRLMVMRLAGDRASIPAAVTDNDRALGMIVEACSRSNFWPRMAIFVVEDDASGGSDHVDPYRSVALAVSPYTRQGSVDSTMYNSASVLRTIELILGLAPMTQFDAAATPMWAAFSDNPDPQPWEAADPDTP